MGFLVKIVFYVIVFYFIDKVVKGLFIQYKKSKMSSASKSAQPSANDIEAEYKIVSED